MDGLLEKILEKYKDKPIPYILCLTVLYILAVAKSWPKGEDGAIFSYIIIACYTLIYCVIIIGTCISNKLPKAQNMRKAILVVIDAENASITKEVQDKLGKLFNEYINHSDGQHYELKFLSMTRVKKMDLKIKDDAVKLLTKTNCAFLVRIRCLTDLTTNAENFRMWIDLGKLHPSLSDAARKLLQMDLSMLSSRIKHAGFGKNQLLDTMDFTAQDLSYVCPYCIGLVEYLTQNRQQAWDIFRSLLGKISLEKNTDRQRMFGPYIQRWAFRSCLEFANSLISEPYDIGINLEYIRQAENLLDTANSIIGDSYDYYINKAYCVILLRDDINEAEACINHCKYKNIDTSWMVDDAFISAYKDESAEVIIQKYGRMFANYKGNDLNHIIQYIEYVVSRSPERVGLHLSLTILYDKFDDYKLAKEHFSQYTMHKRGVEKIKKMKRYLKYQRDI